MKVVEKLVPLQTILDDDDLAGLWIQDKVQRQAAHGTLRAVISAIEDTLGRPFDDFFLPDELNIRPVVAGEKHLFKESGEAFLIDDELGRELPVLPKNFLAFNFCTQHHLTDRANIISSGLNFLQNEGVLVTWTWGPCHGLWNAIKRSAKRCSQGSIWKSILQLLVAYNFNHGPFRSGARRRFMEDILKRWLESHTCEDEGFQSIIVDFAADNGMRCDTPEQQHEVYQRFLSRSMPSAQTHAVEIHPRST